MNINRITPLIFLLLSHQTLALEKAPPEGFLWYNEQALVKEKKQPIKQENVSSKQINDWDQRIEKLKQQLEQAERKAFDNPTLPNILQAQRLQKYVSDKAEKFATMWQIAALLDYQLADFEQHPNSLHKRLQEKKNAKLDDKKLIKIAKNWGMILQFDSICPICHAFVPIVKELAGKYGFQLIAVSRTGEDFNEIKGVADNGFLENSALNPQKLVPVLYLMSSDGKNIYPIARGLTEQSKIIENILTLNKNYRRLEK